MAAGATIALAKGDKILRDAQVELAIAAGDVTRAEAEQARAAEKAAVKTRAAGEAAKGAGGNFGLLASPMGAAVVAGVALSPVAVTLAAGLGGLGLAALGASKDTRAMHQQLAPLKSEVADFQKSLKPQVLTLFGDATGIAGNALKSLQPVAAATGKGLHGFLGELNANFRSGEWQHFFGFMERQAGPDIQMIGRLFIDLTNDLPPLLEGLQPVALGILKIADAGARLPSVLDTIKQKTGAAQQGAAGGTGLDRIRQFITWGERHIPAGNKSISDLIGLTGRANSAVPVTGQAVAATGAAAAAAAPRVGTLAGDIGVLNAMVGSGNSVLAAYGDLWDRFVGKSVDDQQAVLSIRAAFEGYNTTLKTNSRASTAAQQAFLGIFTALGSGLDTLRKNKASVADINSLYTTTIARLGTLHGLTPVQRADVQGVTRDYLAWAGSVDRLSGNTVNAATQIRNTLLAQLGMAHRLTPQVSGDMSALANSILKTGDDSRATAIDRAALIRDFEKSGLSAIQARQAARDFQGQVDRLHGKTVSVDLATSGHGQIIITGTGINQRTINTSTGTLRAVGGHAAAGMLVSGGVPGRDSVLVNTMPGELIVPAHLVAAGAVDHLRGRIPGFAAGGVVGKSAGAEAGIASAEATWAAISATAFAQAAVKAAQAAVPAFGGPGSGALGGDAAANRALARSMFPWPASQWPSFDYLEMREAGYNRFARNPSSGAYGIPQALPESKLPFAGQSGGGSHAGAQLSWMFGYIGQRYGTPFNAALHERFNNWYGNGLDGVFSRPTLIGVGERGRERVQVTPLTGGRGGGSPQSVTIVIENHGVIGSQAEADRFIKNAVDRLATDGQLAYALRHSPSAA